ncbi:hypothetical protein OH809_39410 [Streptomyces sp. NBC_00873]|uniref:hypothetical protein n=1 Tax=unclassified Streptomyces TaxID=2593676 RepID=UPI00386AF29A|nr:hypothetical protein OH809_39410 [Streptomyces sp. NBC_00873]WTA41959.1 hypothetical protein OH821_04285 [Streptomyces sp. NBC_00842]
MVQTLVAEGFTFPTAAKFDASGRLSQGHHVAVDESHDRRVLDGFESPAAVAVNGEELFVAQRRAGGGRVIRVDLTGACRANRAASAATERYRDVQHGFHRSRASPTGD